MKGDLIQFVEELVYARPSSEDEAESVLQWVARREGKRLEELLEERSMPSGTGLK